MNSSSPLIPGKTWLTAEQLAALTGKAPHNVYYWVKTNKLPYVYVGRLLFFIPEQIEQFIADQQRKRRRGEG